MQGEIRRTRILGIDYGRARIGLAFADAQTALARPLDTLKRINRNEDMRRLREIVRDPRRKANCRRICHCGWMDRAAKWRKKLLDSPSASASNSAFPWKWWTSG